MAVDTAVQPDRETAILNPSSPSLRKPTPLDMMQAFGTIHGPSVLLDLCVAASAVTLARRVLGVRSVGAVERRFRPLAGLGVGMAAGYLLVVRPWLRRWGGDRRRESAPPAG